MRRRNFIALSAGLVPPLLRQGPPLKGLPRLDGSMVWDAGSLHQAAFDLGGVVERRPLAVLRPGSVDDVLRIVQYAKAHRVPVAMRGGGHSVYGQSLAERGIVIDSRPLGKARMAGRTIEVEAGASLLHLARTAHVADSALPVMSPCTMLSVGGVLSVGGESLGTRRHGAFVDQVAELDVVTGAGRLISCSAEREPELFSMMLAGMGQCGIIVRARFWVLPAPSHAVTCTLTYDSPEQFLHDQIRFATDLRFDHVSGQILPGPGGSWRCVTTVATLGQKARAPDPEQWLKEYSADLISDLSRLSYREYILPEAKAGDPGSDSSPPHTEPAPPHRAAAQPSLAVWLPAQAGHELIRVLLATPRLTAGVTGMLCRALPTGVFHRPLFRVPAEETMFAFWLRRAVGEHGPALEAQLEANQIFLDRALALGARRYPPYGGPAKPAQWRQHYGDDLYRRFAAAKKRYDPQRILTPGAEMF